MRENPDGIVFSTYASLPVTVAAQKKRNVPAFGYAIADEAHHCLGKANKRAALVLDNSKIRAEKRHFMTATPIVYKEGKGEVELISMDDEAKFGPWVAEHDFAVMVQKGLLCDYEIFAPLMTNESLMEMVDEGTKAALNKEDDFSVRRATECAGLLKTIKKRKAKRVLILCNTKQAAQDYINDVVNVHTKLKPSHKLGKHIETGVITDDTSTTKRHKIIRDFKENPGVSFIAGVHCMSEGIDIKEIDCVAFMQPKRAKREIVQAAGRAMRPHPAKDESTIYVPLVVGPDDDIEKVIDGDPLNALIDIIRGLVCMDTGLRQELKEARADCGIRGGKQRDEKWAATVSRIVGLESSALAKAIMLQVIEKTTVNWWFWFGLLEKFVTREGHALVPVRHVEDGYLLGKWVRNQRSGHGLKTYKGKVTPDQAQRLEQLPEWSWKLKDEWTNELCAFDGCGRKTISYGKCASHRRQEVQGKPLTPIKEQDAWASTNVDGMCVFPGCHNKAKRGLCQSHRKHKCDGELKPLRKKSKTGILFLPPAAHPQALRLWAMCRPSEAGK